MSKQISVSLRIEHRRIVRSVILITVPPGNYLWNCPFQVPMTDKDFHSHRRMLSRPQIAILVHNSIIIIQFYQDVAVDLLCSWVSFIAESVTDTHGDAGDSGQPATL
jgi:hypothetical protein